MAATSRNQNNTAARLPNRVTAETPTRVGGAAAARQACAACKHQRRRCSQCCPLAPYFPADKQKEFHNVHKLFGINNVVKILRKVPQQDRDDAMKSVIYEANLRAINPVGGCYTVIRDLQKEIQLCMSELDIVLKHLAFCRANQGHVRIEMAEAFCKNQESSSSQVTDCRNQETVKNEMVQLFLNEPTEWRESNESGGNEVLKDDD